LKSELKELRDTEFSGSGSPDIPRRSRQKSKDGRDRCHVSSSQISGKSQKSWREISLRRKLDYRLEEICRRTENDPFKDEKGGG
jgi:hypothetical protein